MGKTTPAIDYKELFKKFLKEMRDENDGESVVGFNEGDYYTAAEHRALRQLEDESVGDEYCYFYAAPRPDDPPESAGKWSFCGTYSKGNLLDHYESGAFISEAEDYSYDVLVAWAESQGVPFPTTYPIVMADAVRYAVEKPEYRNNGQYQFVKEYTGGGNAACVHLTTEEIAQRLTAEKGPGELIDDGVNLWWEIKRAAAP